MRPLHAIFQASLAAATVATGLSLAGCDDSHQKSIRDEQRETDGRGGAGAPMPERRPESSGISGVSKSSGSFGGSSVVTPGTATHATSGGAGGTAGNARENVGGTSGGPTSTGGNAATGAQAGAGQ